jgi:hypothetical protein
MTSKCADSLLRDLCVSEELELLDCRMQENLTNQNSIQEEIKSKFKESLLSSDAEYFAF